MGHKVRAIVSQAPSLDGLANIMFIMRQRGVVASMRIALMGLTDMCRGLFGLSPAYIRMFGKEKTGFPVLELSADEVISLDIAVY